MNMETLVYKAIYFDLDINQLRIHFSANCPHGGYAYILRFMLKHRFAHAQGSGYHSMDRTTDLAVLELISQMITKFPWFKLCVNKIEMTDLGVNSNLKDVVPELKEHIWQANEKGEYDNDQSGS